MATAAVRNATRERYEDLARVIGQGEAAHQMDWEIARDYAKRKLARRRIEREPTDLEIARVLEWM